ncbi:unnamed protein product [Pedinophyceae sp. YPF-701]|nr:unnamed protein product [Pedinophyceae sp. YPF-701]
MEVDAASASEGSERSFPGPDALRVDPSETGCSEQERFTAELEFVQCLGNPQYLQWLAMTKRLSDPAMVAYLDYLQYWHRPEYARMLVFPRCLWFLKQLQEGTFREALRNPHFVNELNGGVMNSWLFYGPNRVKEEKERARQAT